MFNNDGVYRLQVRWIEASRTRRANASKSWAAATTSSPRTSWAWANTTICRRREAIPAPARCRARPATTCAATSTRQTRTTAAASCATGGRACGAARAAVTWVYRRTDGIGSTCRSTRIAVSNRYQIRKGIIRVNIPCISLLWRDECTSGFLGFVIF